LWFSWVVVVFLGYVVRLERDREFMCKHPKKVKKREMSVQEVILAAGDSADMKVDIELISEKTLRPDISNNITTKRQT